MGTQYDDDDILDFTDVQAATGEPLPKGIYHVRVHSAKTHEAESGNMVLDFDLVVLEPESFQGRHVFPHQTVTPQGMPFVKACLEAILGREIGRESMTKMLQEALDRELVVRLKVTQQEGYNPKNEVSTWITMEDAEKVAVGVEAPSTRPTERTGTDLREHARKVAVSEREEASGQPAKRNLKMFERP